MSNIRNGITEWLFQRLSNVLIFCFAIFYILNLLVMGEVTYQDWVALHDALWFKVYATVTLIIVMVNSLLAGWQIATDYSQKVPLPGFGSLFHGFYTLVTLGFLGFGLFILWLL